MKIKKIGIPLILICAGFLPGCVAKQSVPYFYNPPAYDTQKINGGVESSVQDERTFILNKDKDPSYIGHFRAGFGNTWDVKTKGHVALAEQFQSDLEKELEALGAEKGATGSKKKLVLSILDYNFDAYLNVRFWYKFKVAVFDAGGNLLAQDVLEKEQVIKGSFWWGPAGATKREMPALHAQIVRSLVRDNEKILKALLAA